MAAAWLCASSAFAHDPPQIRNIVWRENASDVLLQTNRGLIFGDPKTQHWELMCNEALRITSSETPSLAYMPDGRLLVATSSGLKSSADHGCTWQVMFEELLVPAMAVHPERPERVFISTFPLGMASEAISGDSAIRVSEDSGKTWSSLLENPDDDFVNGLHIAPSDPDRLYATGGVYKSTGREFYVSRSSDAGATWERFMVELGLDDSNMEIMAVSPVDPDLVLLKIEPNEPRSMPERLLVSRNGGESFEHATDVMMLRNVGFSADGATVWLAGDVGLFRSSDDLATFEQVGKTEVATCAVEHEGALHVCGWWDGLGADPRTNGVGLSNDLGESFQPWMTFQDVTQPLSCPDGSPTPATCQTAWRDWEYEVMNMFSPESLNRDGGAPLPTGDAGTVDAGTGGFDAGVPQAGNGAAGMGTAGSAGAQMPAAGAGMPETPTESHSNAGGCAVQTPRPTRGLAWLTPLLTLLALRLTRRRTSSSN